MYWLGWHLLPASVSVCGVSVARSVTMHDEAGIQVLLLHDSQGVATDCLMCSDGGHVETHGNVRSANVTSQEKVLKS